MTAHNVHALRCQGDDLHSSIFAGRGDRLARDEKQAMFGDDDPQRDTEFAIRRIHNELDSAFCSHFATDDGAPGY